MDVQAIDPSRAAAPATPTAAAPAAPAAPLPGDIKPPAGLSADGVQQDETLHKALAQVFGSDISVQFQVVKGTNDIVTVFKSKSTGQVIQQFPPEAMVLIAQFFNKLAGAVLDRKA